MIDLARAEWIRLRSRGDLWLVGLGVVALTIVGYVSGIATPADVNFVPPGEEVPPDLIRQWEAQARETLALHAFPNSIENGLQGGRILIYLVVAYLAAAFTGADFDYGTIRTSLVARGDRRGFIVVRLASTLVVALVLIAIVVALSIVMPFIAAALGTDFPEVPSADLGSIAGMLGAVVATVAFLIGLATLIAILSRSAAIAVVLTLVYAFGDTAVSGLITQVAGEGSAVRWVPPLTNAQLLFERATGSTVGPQWPTLVGGALAIAWIAIVCVLSVRALVRADIHV